MFFYVGITSENDESHVVMQAWRFHLDVKNEMASFHQVVKVKKKGKTTMGSSRRTSFETSIISYHQHFSKYFRRQETSDEVYT